jgi:23S rRNA (adenine2030-N6)-methyltransferase
MNYRHHFHAGGPADVFKHLVLVQLVRGLQRKPAPITYLDTHAGAGEYDLGHEMAQRTGEYTRGVARLWAAEALPPALADLLDLCRGVNPDGALRVYPGSPRLVQALLRTDDRLIACELRAEEAARLQAALASRRDERTAVHRRDGYEALGALLPPTPRRGLALIDPPYERPDEFAAALAGLQLAHARWATGCLALWYPIKGPVAAAKLHAGVLRSGLRRVLRVELRTGDERDPDVLAGSGMLVVNPPWKVDEALGAALPDLAARLADGAGSAHVDWLVGE